MCLKIPALKGLDYQSVVLKISLFDTADYFFTFPEGKKFESENKKKH